jgi:hypothetical protein
MRPNRDRAALQFRLALKRRSAMRKIKDVLRLKFEAKLSHERIAAATESPMAPCRSTCSERCKRVWGGRYRLIWTKGSCRAKAA